MPSPVGHSLIGLAAANLPLKRRLYTSFFWFCFVLAAANAPDLDFLPGWITGDINRHHHGISHSIGMAFIYAALSSIVAHVMKQPWRMAFLIALTVFLSHLLADYITVDKVKPYGAPFLWPLSSEYFLAPVQVFQPIEHGDPGEASAHVIGKMFSRENVVAAALEVLLIFPLWLLTWWIGRRGQSCAS